MGDKSNMADWRAWPYMNCLTLNFLKVPIGYLAFFSCCVLLHEPIYFVEKVLIDIPRERTHIVQYTVTGDGMKSRVEPGTRTCDFQTWISH